MKKFSIVFFVIMAAFLSFSASFAAITYDYSSDTLPPFYRYIEAEATVGENMEGPYLEESFSEDPFLEEVYASVGDIYNPESGFAEANSWQNSIIVASNESLYVDAEGNYNATFIGDEQANAYASNALTVRFTVEDPIYYQLYWLSAYSQINLFAEDSGTIFDIVSLGFDSDTKSGNLEPGYYEFFIYNGGPGSEYGGYGGYDVEFSVSNVPLPGGIWLLGTGLIGIVGIRRKLKK